jgi:hypothetical protein
LNLYGKAKEVNEANLEVEAVKSVIISCNQLAFQEFS